MFGFCSVAGRLFHIVGLPSKNSCLRAECKFAEQWEYALLCEVTNALNTLVSREKPGSQALSKGLIVLLCAEAVRQGAPDHVM